MGFSEMEIRKLAIALFDKATQRHIPASAHIISALKFNEIFMQPISCDTNILQLLSIMLTAR